MKGRKHSLIKILMETLRKFLKINSPHEMMNSHLVKYREELKKSGGRF